MILGPVGKFFLPVGVFLSFNICDWLGRTLAGLLKWPRKTHMWIVLLLCLSRFCIVPFCLLSNQQPRTRLPVIFYHDAFPMIIVIILGLSNGYLMTISMMHASSFASRGNAEKAGAAMPIYLVLGLSFGVLLSVGYVQII